MRIASHLFREILDGIQSELSALDHQKTLAEDEGAPTITEIAAIDRVRKILRGTSALIKIELDDLDRVTNGQFRRSESIKPVPSDAGEERL
ncbi:hypothetical protein HDF08_003536 [Edaphobacter lichenicola]|uniref:Uncharacterized protein n=1 Tax=Tunturiibacter lichenicola TaxID=2051959 RepID=A0A852VLZ3_9BACT|nr:hypothetical protein [Edaphobacter lichenicola]